MSETGKRTMPFWSTKSRALKIVESVPAYEGFEVVEIDLADWRANWLPGLAEDGLLVGINWSGPRAKGYDLEPSSVAKRLAAALAATSSP